MGNRYYEPRRVEITENEEKYITTVHTRNFPQTETFRTATGHKRTNP
jgi:hypothetical protein